MTERSKKPIYKVLLLGDQSVGKTCFIARVVNNTFNSTVATIGVDYRVKNMKNKQGEESSVQIWDTAGAERFRSISKSYYKGAHGILILFDCTSKESYMSMENWVEQVKENSSDNVILYIVASKIDLKEDRCVSTQMGQKFANDLGLKYYETSAKDNINVNETFQEFFDDIDLKFKDIVKKKGNSKVINSGNKKEKKSCC